MTRSAGLAAPDPKVLLEEVRRGEDRALARAITLAEAGDPAVREALGNTPWPGTARVIALTGPPGVGKSVLADALGRALAAPGAGGVGRRIGIVAVDPSSPRTHGALLGDRARMRRGAEGIFFRSMAARGGAGALAPEVGTVLRLLALSGRDRILLETAGAGQGEHAVTALADVTLALLAPGHGDEVQAAKAGLFEVADLVVVAQADRPGAEATAALWRATRAADAPPVLLASGKEGTGVPELVGEIERALAATAPRERRFSAGTSGHTPFLGAARLHHVGVAVRDADAFAAQWKQLLGLAESSRHRVEEFGVLALFLQPQPENDESGAGLVELVEPTAPGPVSRFIERRGEGLHHVCFEVEDIYASLEALRARGVRLVDETPRRGAGGHLVAFLHPAAAGGVLVELKQADRAS